MSKKRSKRRQSLLDIEFHPEAKKLLDQLTEDFRENVSIETQKQAKRDGANSVQSYHVREAIKKEYEKTRTKNIIGELSKIFGSILFGSFVPYIVTSIHSQNSSLPIMYLIFGFVGVIMIFMSYISK